MGDLTKNISRHEVECKCNGSFGVCHAKGIDIETALIVQDACDHFAEKRGLERSIVLINSASRCPGYNDAPVSEGGAGGSDNSYHKTAMAIDHRIQGVSIKDLYDYYNKKYPNRLGLGYYPPNEEKGTRGFVHLDSRSRRARW